MTEIRVRFFGPVRGLVRKKEQVILLEEGATLRRLLEELGRSNSSEFQRHIVLDGGSLNPALLVFLDGESVNAVQNLDLSLLSGSMVDVMLASPIMGG